MYQHYQCVVQDGGDEALRDNFQGVLHALDNSHRRMCHTHTHARNDRHVLASKHVHQDEARKHHDHHNLNDDLHGGKIHLQLGYVGDGYLPILVHNVVRSGDLSLAHALSQVRKNKEALVQNLLLYLLDDRVRSLFQFLQGGLSGLAHILFQQQMNMVAQVQILFIQNSITVLQMALFLLFDILAQAMVLSQQFYGLSFQVYLHRYHVRRHQLQSGTCHH